LKELIIHRVYFAGIGGIGMSALARYFYSSGKLVAGYDKTPGRITGSLEEEGIHIHYSDDINCIPEEFKDPEGTLVVYTPAIPGDHKELNWFVKNGFVVMKRAALLGRLTADKKAVTVAGTHGKTTISTMISHILYHSPVGCTAFLGGISKNFHSNLVLSSLSEYVVTEADEYDRSFLNLYPYISVITAMDEDHLDIYGDKSGLTDSFNRFLSQTKPGGTIIYKHGLSVNRPEHIGAAYTYSLHGPSDFYASSISTREMMHCFDLVTPGGLIKDLCCGLPGIINVENAVAASAVAVLLGAAETSLRTSLNTFAGIERRFDLQLVSEKVIYIDDYAHHPVELEAFIGSVRELFPGKRLTGIFQPHLYSRTKDFAPGFARSLSKLDELILLDIYPAREKAIPGVSSELIFDKLKIDKKIICRKEDLLKQLDLIEPEVLLSMGAGDIDRFTLPIRELLIEKYKLQNTV